MQALPQEAESFIRRGRVGRLATVDVHGRPHMVPICYAYTPPYIYSAVDLKPKTTAPEQLRRVRNIRTNPQVQVLIDEYSEDWCSLAFVQLRGTAEILTAGYEYHRALRLLERKYRQYTRLPLCDRPVIKVAVEHVVTWGRLELWGADRTAEGRTAPPKGPPDDGETVEDALR